MPKACVPDAKGTLTSFWNKGKRSQADQNEHVDLTTDRELADEADACRAKGENAAVKSLNVVELTPDAPGGQAPQGGDVESVEQLGEERTTPQALPQEKAAAEATDRGDKGEKKRKRAPNSYTEEQTAALAALFARDNYPKTLAKKELGEELGLDLDQVNKWFEKRRKKRRADTGEAPQRGRPSKAAAGPADDPEQPAVGCAGSNDVPPVHAAQPASEPAPAVSGATGAADPAVPMEVEGSAESEEQVAPTPAAHLKVPETMVKAPAPGPASAAPPSTAAATQPAAMLEPTVRVVSAEERALLLSELAEEADKLRGFGLSAPLTDLAAAAAAPAPYSDARLAALVAGQRLPLPALATALLPVFFARPSAAPKEDALRSRILDLATRKSHAPKEHSAGGGGAAAAVMDSLNDAAPGSLWQWELRDAKALPKEQRPAAMAIKRRAGRVGDRLTAVVSALRMLSAHTEGTAKAKLVRALDALTKTKTLKQLEAEAQADAEAAAAKKAQAQAGVKQSPTKRAQQAAEMEQARRDKEAEKERLRQEKEAEKEQHRQEKEAEKERKHTEAEKERLRKKTGFKDAAQLHKSANKFASFFKPKPAAAAAVTPASDPGCSPSGSRPGSEGGPAEGGTTSKATKAACRGYADLFLKPTPDCPPLHPSYPPAGESMDAALAAGIGAEQVAAEWRYTLEKVRAARTAARCGEGAGHRAALALPPSWARRSDAETAAEARLWELHDGGVDPGQLRTWRRKFVWFPADSARPPYYGSWTRDSATVRPRRPMGRDETLDYEVMSDLDWEEEPEGSSLSGADSMSEGGGGDESEAEDSFVVDDGYLSEHEGVRLEEEDDVDMADAQAAGPALGGATDGGGADAARERADAALRVQLDRARRAGRPLIITRFPNVGSAGDGATGTFLSGDHALLEALAMEALLPGVGVTVPEDPAVEAAGGGGTAVPDSAAKGDHAAAAVAASGTEPAAACGGQGRPKLERPEDLLPNLAAFIQANSQLLKPKMVESFIEAHPGRKIPKKWVNGRVTAMAERQGGRWVLKPARPAAAAAVVGAEAASVVEAAPEEAAASLAGWPLDRLLKKSAAGGGSMATLEVPSGATGQGLLVATTAAGAQALEVPVAVSSPLDPYWSALLQHIEDVDVAQRVTFGDAFKPDTMAQHAQHMPAFVLSALVTALNSGRKAGAVRSTLTRCLRHAVDALAELGGASGKEGDATLSQRAWGEPRASPVVASVAELCKEPGLLGCLAVSMSAAVEVPAAATHALQALAALAAVPEGREMLAEMGAAARAALAAAVAACDVISELQQSVDALKRTLSGGA